MTTPKHQAQRILAHFLLHPNIEISAVELNPIGAGGSGYCASFSRRISDLRKLGYNIVKSRDEWKDGQRHTWYVFRTEDDKP